MALAEREYAWLSAREIAAGVKARRFKAEEVIRVALARAHRLDPRLKVFITLLEEEALRRARAVDEAVAEGRDPGLLAGVPVAVKDNLCLRGARTTCASKILENYLPPYTATAVERALAEGAVPLGKTNLDEFAMGSSTENSGFFSTRNPWDEERVPGGSSGASAVAVAAGLAPLAFGTDTGGSIRQPAAFCGVTGLKPTYGRVSRYGLVAYGSSLDQIGPLAREAADAALFLAVMAGPDPRDATCSTLAPPPELRRLEAPENLAGVRLGVPREYFIAGLDDEVRRRVEEALESLRALGARTVDISLPHTEYAVAVYYLVATAEASSNLARYDGMHYGRRTPAQTGLVEMYARSRAEGFGAEVKRRIMLGTYALSSGYYEAYYLKAQRARALIKDDFDRAWENCDVIVCPTAPTPPFRLGEKVASPLAMYLSDIFTLSANLASLPALSLSCGFTGTSLPVGLQLLGRPFAELELLRLAAAYQRRTDHHLRRPALAENHSIG